MRADREADLSAAADVETTRVAPAQGGRESATGQQQASRCAQQPRPEPHFDKRAHSERRTYRNNAQA
jgi:hypothetical protein